MEIILCFAYICSMITISNKHLTAKIKPFGAELCSLIENKKLTEFIWEGLADWPKHSPVLFPIVGSLKDNTYEFNNKSYSLNRHGFARDKQFSIESQSANSVCLLLNADEETKKLYPFDFRFKVCYTLLDNKLQIEYGVENFGSQTMPFSIGAHPAFKIPNQDGLTFEDYSIEFEEFENAGIFPLNEDGLLSLESVPFLKNTNKLPLSKDLFLKDALIFKTLSSKSVLLKSELAEFSIRVNFANFPFLGIWSKPPANFVCIEPWQGITDGVNATGRLEEKEGIILLSKKEKWQGSWQIAII